MAHPVEVIAVTCTVRSRHLTFDRFVLLGVVTGDTPRSLIGIIIGSAGPGWAGTVAVPVSEVERFLQSAQGVDPNVPLLTPPMN
jgi:hypothetical protein